MNQHGLGEELRDMDKGGKKHN